MISIGAITGSRMILNHSGGSINWNGVLLTFGTIIGIILLLLIIDWYQGRE